MKKIVAILRKTAIALIGIPVFIIGVILIPAPGPGLLVCFLGLLILSLEFEWAKKHRDNARSQLKKIVNKSEARQEKINKKYK